MSASQRFTQMLSALDAVIKHLDQVQSSTAASAEFAALTTEVNAALEAATNELEQMLSALVGPVWAELPESVRAVCEEALSRSTTPQEPNHGQE
jgi:hypothetical protein